MHALKRSRPLLGTFVEIEVRDEAADDALNAWVTRGFEAVAEVESRMSYFREDSDVSRLNRAPTGAWVDVHPWTARVLAHADEVFKASRGLFDIRCGSALARAGVLPGRPPAGGARGADARRSPVETRGSRARKTGPWVIDLGGIAKGFAVDQAVAAIKAASRGARSSGWVNAGGDLRAWGAASAVAVREGLGGFGLRGIEIRCAAVATSSMRTGTGSGRESPAAYVRRGRLVDREASATVIARSCWQADALTKVALLGARDRATRCLKVFAAKGVVFGSGAPAARVLG